MLPLAIDAMGGDHAPRAIIEGVGDALDSIPRLGGILVVGKSDQIEAELQRIGKLGHPKIEVVHADQVVEMHEAPAATVRSKKHSSIAICTDLVKQGRAGAVVSAGNTGAAVASAVLRIRTLSGIERPGIATVFPVPTGNFLLLDAGANVDCKPKHLVHYGLMGEIYAREILGVKSPRVGLLNVGNEEGKGNELAKVVHKTLSGLPDINYIGNIEGHDLFEHGADVVVCDGFVGNIVLKVCESMARAFGSFLKDLLRKNPMRMTGALLAQGAFKDFKDLVDSERYGGAPLLGLNAVCIIAHGASSPKAIRNAIRVAEESLEHHLTDTIVRRVGEIGL
jgi:glycerol-3-phosphate acyltransferase PlsX